MLKKELSTLEYQADCPIARLYFYQTKGKSVRESALENEPINAAFSHIRTNCGHFQTGGRTCAIQSPCAALRHAASVGGPQPGAAKNHICLDKNRSMPRNQIQKQREIPNQVVQYAEHTAPASTAASVRASSSAEVNEATLSHLQAEWDFGQISTTTILIIVNV